MYSGILISSWDCFNLINVVIPTIPFVFILIKSSDMWCSICFCYKLITPKISLYQRVAFAHVDRSSNFYFISLSIGWCIASQDFFSRHMFARRYSSFGSSTILFIYIIWLADNFLYLSMLVSLPTSFLYHKVLVFSCFLRLIQTPRNLVLSSSFLTLTRLSGVPICIESSSFSCLYSLQAIASDLAPFILILFSIKKLFNTWIIFCRAALDSATYIVSSAYANIETITFSILYILFLR